jgi:hypothetical protein
MKIKSYQRASYETSKKKIKNKEEFYSRIEYLEVFI